LESNSVEADISIWRISEAPASLRTVFYVIPEDGWIAELSSSFTNIINPAFEAALFCLLRSPVLARARLTSGGVALLLAP